MLRTRQMGSKALVDVHIQVTPHVSVSEGHRISDEVSNRLVNEIEVVSQVLVHIDPENDEAFSSCKELPLRDEVLNLLITYIKQFSQTTNHQNLIETILTLLLKNNSEDLILHYSNGKISVNILLPFEEVNQLNEVQQLQSVLESNLAELKIIEKISFGFLE